MSQPFALTNSLAISIQADADAAVKAGHTYDSGDYTGLRLDLAVIVRDGTVSGNPTVDLVLVDEKGNKYMTMITGNLLKNVTNCL